jgi:hypothetical protein
LFPDTPGPEKIPPGVVGIRVAGEALEQYEAFSPEKVALGVGFTVATTWSEAEQPPPPPATQVRAFAIIFPP